MGGALYALAAGSVRMSESRSQSKLMAGKEARSFLLAHLAKSHYTKPLSSLDDVKDFVERCYPSLETEMVNVGGEAGNGSERWVVVLSSKYVTLLRSPIRPARMVFHEDGRYTVEVLLAVVRSGSWKESLPPHRDICSGLDTFLAHSGYVICPGIVMYESEFESLIRFQSKNLRIWTHPLARHDLSSVV